MLLLTLFFTMLLYQGEGGASAKPPAAAPTHWYEQVTGILAIPAALITGTYSYLLIHRTRLESRKLELEIQEKTAARVAAASAPGAISPQAIEGRHQEAIAETLVNRQYSVLLLRYVVMELALHVYNGITAPINWVESLSTSGLYALTGGHLAGPVAVIIEGAQTVASTVVNAGYWLLFLVLGWPLFKDVNAVLGIDMSAYSPRSVFRGVLPRKAS